MEPLLANEETGGIERNWEEMHETGELLGYLKAALRCEEILMNRRPDLERAQEITRAEPVRKRTRKR
jgi:hypothetical protein